MAQDSVQQSVQQIGDERRRSLEIIRQVSETIGTEFCFMLVKHLRRVLGAGCVYVCEFVGRQNERARALAACMKDDRMETLEFPLAGSPDAELGRCHPCVYSRGAREVFPTDARLRDLEVEAWVGIPLNNAEEQACGLIAALVECLARAHQLEKARSYFDKLLCDSNHLGLFSEQIARDGHQLGNFPQALTHLALISAALCLDRRLSGTPTEPWS